MFSTLFLLYCALIDDAADVNKYLLQNIQLQGMESSARPEIPC